MIISNYNEFVDTLYLLKIVLIIYIVCYEKYNLSTFSIKSIRLFHQHAENYCISIRVACSGSVIYTVSLRSITILALSLRLLSALIASISSLDGFMAMG